MFVILPVWITDDETLELTKAAIDSIRAAMCDKKLLIVDNASTVGGGYLRQEADIYIREKENVGYPKAVNHGLSLVDEDFICIANNDIRVQENAFLVAYDVFEDESVGSVHFRMIPYDEPMSVGMDTWKTGKERWCSSSFFCIRRKAAQRYDEEYRLGGYDDWDYWYRIRELDGWKTAYTNRSCYQHKDSHTQNKLDQHKRAIQDAVNRGRFKQKFGDYPEILFAQKYSSQLREQWKPFP